MGASRRPVSLAAERALRILRERQGPVDSIRLVEQVLATRVADEPRATRLLETAFGADPRLAYRDGAWTSLQDRNGERGSSAGVPERDRVLVLVQGAPSAPRGPFQLEEVAGIRLQGETVVAACGGQPVRGTAGEALREEFLEILDDAVPVVHEAPVALAALERWLEEPLDVPVSVRQLARDRLNLPVNHDLETLAERLDLDWREPDELLDRAEILDACLQALRREGESLQDLRAALTRGATPLSWSRYDFDRGFLRSIPRVAGTYRFYDAEGRLLYVGKAKDLHRRIGSYFREGRRRAARVQALLDELHHIEYEPLESDLEAMLREAVEIEQREPSKNVQRQVHVSGHHRTRMRSIMILEPASGPFVLRAYLLRDGRFIDKIGIGPRGGGLRRIERLLADRFFSIADGPTPAVGPDVSMEVVGRWLAANRDRVVAFDPTTLRSPAEVVMRLRGLLAAGVLFDPDGTPVRIR